MANLSKISVGKNIRINADITKPIQDISDRIARAGDFIGKVMGPPIEAGGGLLDDQFQHWRATNIERIRNKWMSRRQKRGVSKDAIRHLPFDMGIRFFESASTETSDEVQELWAGLLDAATDPKSNVNVRKVHVDILRSVSAVEVNILRFLWTDASAKREMFDQFIYEKYPIEERAIAIQNLQRNKCIRFVLNESLMAEINYIDDVLKDGEDVPKAGLRQVIHAIGDMIKDLSGENDLENLNLNKSPYYNELNPYPGPHGCDPEDRYELTALGRDLMTICSGGENN